MRRTTDITPSPTGLSTEPLTIPSPSSLPYLASNSVVSCAPDTKPDSNKGNCWELLINPPGSCSEPLNIPLLANSTPVSVVPLPTKLFPVIVEVEVIEPVTLNEPVMWEEPLTSNSPVTFDAVTTP